MQHRPSVVYLFAVAAVAPVGFSVVVVALPAIAAGLAASVAAVFQTMSVFMLVFGALQLVLGPVSDRYGRRPVLIAGLALFSGASLWCAIAGSIETLLIARTFQAAGGCVALVVPRAVVRDAFTGHDAVRAMTIVTMAQSTIPAIAPLVGGLLVVRFPWQAVFLFCSAYGLVALVWTCATYRETLPARARLTAIPSLAQYAALLGERNYVAYMLNAALLTVPYVVFLTVAPTLLIREAGLSAAAFGLYNLTLIVSVLAGSFVAARLGARLAAHRLVLLASSIAVASLCFHALLAEVVSVWRLFGPILLYIAAHAVLFPLAVTSGIAATPAMAGTASGFIGFAQTGLGALALVLIGQFDTTNAYPAAMLSLAAAAAGLASLALARRRT